MKIRYIAFLVFLYSFSCIQSSLLDSSVRDIFASKFSVHFGYEHDEQSKVSALDKALASFQFRADPDLQDWLQRNYNDISNICFLISKTGTKIVNTTVMIGTDNPEIGLFRTLKQL